MLTIPEMIWVEVSFYGPPALSFLFIFCVLCFVALQIWRLS